MKGKLICKLFKGNTSAEVFVKVSQANNRPPVEGREMIDGIEKH